MWVRAGGALSQRRAYFSAFAGRGAEASRRRSPAEIPFDPKGLAITFSAACFARTADQTDSFIRLAASLKHLLYSGPHAGFGVNTFQYLRTNVSTWVAKLSCAA